MPSEIDTDARLSEIAQATLELAREHGPEAITIRAVAARMGRSTTVITKFVPSRSALLMNALTYVRQGWNEAMPAALDGRSGPDLVRAFVAWTLDTVDYDDAVRRLWNEILAKEGSDSEQLAALRDEAHDEHASIRTTFADAGVATPPWLVDLLFLAFRGYFVSTVEDPEEWPPDRAQAAVLGMLEDVVLSAAERQPDPTGPGPAAPSASG